MLKLKWVLSGIFLTIAFSTPVAADGDDETCASKKIDAAGGYYRCLSQNAADALNGDTEDGARCEKRLNRKFRKAERRDACAVTGDSSTIGDFLADVQWVVDDAIVTGAELPQVIEPVCDPSAVNLLDFEFFRNDEGYWCGDATLLGPDGTPLQSEIFPYPYANYKLFWVNYIDGDDIQNRTLAMYPPLAPERCAELNENGIPNALGNGACGENGAGKIYVGDQTASNCSGTVTGVFPIGSVPLFSEAALLTDSIQTYRQEYTEGGVLLLDGITTLQNGALVTNGQIWNPLQPPGIDQLYGAYYDRMRKCTEAEFFAQIAFWSSRYKIPLGATCGIDSANMPSDTTCVEFFDVNIPPFIPPILEGVLPNIH